MGKFIHIKVNEKQKYDRLVTIKLKNNQHIIERKLWIEKNKEYVKFNVWSFNEPVKFVNISHNFVEVFITDNKMISDAQCEYDKKCDVQEKHGIKFARHYNKNQRLIITFPGFIAMDCQIMYPMDFISEINSVNQLVLQDNFFTNGSYLTMDENGNNIIDNVIKLIKEEISDLQIREEDITFFGTSKGASIALKYGSYFPKAKIMAVAPQTDIGKYMTDPYIFGGFYNNSLKKNWEYYNFDINSNYNFQKIFEQLKKNKQDVLILQGYDDIYSNNIDDSKLCIQVKGSHNQVIKNFRAQYISLLEDNEKLSKQKLITKYKVHKIKKYNFNNKYLNIEYEQKKLLDKQAIIKVYADGKNISNLWLNTDIHNGKFYNIMIKDKKNIKIYCESDSIKINCFLSKKRSYTEDEKVVLDKSNETNIDGVNLYYRTNEAKQDEYKKLLISLPGFGYHYDKNQLINYYLKTSPKYLQYSFIDNYLISGSYMTLDDDGNSVLDAIVKFVESKLNEYNLLKEDMIIFGASKGGTIGLKLREYFPESRIICSVPNLNIEFFFKYRSHFNNTIATHWLNHDFNYQQELSFENNINLLGENSLLIEGVNDVSSMVQDEKVGVKNLMKVHAPHNKITKLTKNYWFDYLEKSEDISVKFNILNKSQNVELDIVFEETTNLINYKEYSDVDVFIEFISLNTGMKFITNLAKLKNKDNFVNVYCIRKLDNHINNVSKYIKGQCEIKIIVVNNKNNRERYCGSVYNANGQKTILDVNTGLIIN